MEKLNMRLQVLGGETLAELNVCFRKKVQLEEQVAENDIRIHYLRGVMQALDTVQKEIKEVQKGERIADMYENKDAVAVNEGDHSGKPEELPIKPTVKA